MCPWIPGFFNWSLAKADDTTCATLARSSMRALLLLRPVPGNERFGLGSFFRIEPLGMEYIAAAREARGLLPQRDLS